MDPGGGSRDALPCVPMFSFSCSLWGKLGIIIGWRPFFWEILDPPLESCLKNRSYHWFKYTITFPLSQNIFHGFMIHNCAGVELVGSVGHTEMLHRTNLLAVVGGGAMPKFAENTGKPVPTPPALSARTNVKFEFVTK